MPERKLRMYEPIWLTLKKNKTCTIFAPPRYHKRIVKAVIKEKWMDDEFKSREGWRQHWLTYSCNDQTGEITFSINYKLTELLPHEF